MHDLKALRADPAAFDAALARRGLSPVGQQLVSDDEGRRAALAALQEAQGARKALAKEIGLLKRQKLDTAEIEAKAVALRDQIAGLEERANTIQTRIDDVLKSLPNCLDASVPDGKGEDENVVVHVRGEKREFAFEAKQHLNSVKRWV